MGSRAAVFASQPQAVEVYERGGWLPASMLGWRHDLDGACSAWVRVELAGVVEDAWVELTRLRLPRSPARHPSSAREPEAGGRTAVPAGSMPDPAETQQLLLVRDDAASTAGRRVAGSGGRRRAPDTGAPGAPGAAPPQAPAGSVPGRHRAPAGRGRHRAADSGVLAGVPDGAESSPAAPRDPGLPIVGADRWSPPPVRSVLPPAGPVVRGPAVHPAGAERLTRPMRLEEGIGSARRPRRDSLPV